MRLSFLNSLSVVPLNGIINYYLMWVVRHLEKVKRYLLKSVDGLSFLLAALLDAATPFCF